MSLDFSAVFRKDSAGGFVAFVDELPGANTEGETMLGAEFVRERLTA